MDEQALSNLLHQLIAVCENAVQTPAVLQKERYARNHVALLGKEAQLVVEILDTYLLARAGTSTPPVESVEEGG